MMMLAAGMDVAGLLAPSTSLSTWLACWSLGLLLRPSLTEPPGRSRLPSRRDLLHATTLLLDSWC
jgi:hypothetical protein